MDASPNAVKQIINLSALTNLEPVPPSEFERGVASELKALAVLIESGDQHIKSVSWLITDSGQKIEIEVH